MVWAFVVVLGIIVVGGVIVAMVVGGLVVGAANLMVAPQREPTSTTGTLTLGGLGIASLFAAGGAQALLPGSWFIPPLLWLIAFVVVRNTQPMMETEQQRQARQAAERKQAEEDEKRAAARKAVAERKRVDSFTKDGLALLKRARVAVADVNATEAARAGWLGEREDLDFSADLKAISDTLLQARRIEKVVEKTKKIPDPSPDDTAMLRDAQKTVKALRSESKARVTMIEDCAKQAREIDRLLAEEHRQQQLDEQRDEARRQLAAELYYAEVTPAQRESDTADLIAARVAAFKELKHIVDESVQREIEGGGANPVQNAFDWVRRALPF